MRKVNQYYFVNNYNEIAIVTAKTRKRAWKIINRNAMKGLFKGSAIIRVYKHKEA